MKHPGSWQGGSGAVLLTLRGHRFRAGRGLVGPGCPSDCAARRPDRSGGTFSQAGGGATDRGRWCVRMRSEAGRGARDLSRGLRRGGRGPGPYAGAAGRRRAAGGPAASRPGNDRLIQRTSPVSAEEIREMRHRPFGGHFSLPYARWGENTRKVSRSVTEASSKASPVGISPEFLVPRAVGRRVLRRPVPGPRPGGGAEGSGAARRAPAGGRAVAVGEASAHVPTVDPGRPAAGSPGPGGPWTPGAGRRPGVPAAPCREENPRRARGGRER
jgi:hypothetical protein